MKLFSRLFDVGRLRREKRALAEEKRVLVDQLRQIEFRLAMCRSTAHDVHAAHGIAIAALRPHGGPWQDSAIFYQRRLVRDDREARQARRDRIDADSAAAQ